MAKCVPGTPCYKGEDVIVYTTYPKGCTSSSPSTTGYSLPISSSDLYYSGPNLPNSEIETTDNITVSLQKIDVKLTPSELVAAVISAIQADDTLRVALCTALNC